MSYLILRNVRVDGRRTSVRLEREMWDALQEICAREDWTVDEICGQVAGTNGEKGLTSGLRVFIVSYFRGNGRTAGAAAEGERPYGWRRNERLGSHSRQRAGAAA